MKTGDWVAINENYFDVNDEGEVGIYVNIGSGMGFVYLRDQFAIAVVDNEVSPTEAPSDVVVG